MAKNEYSPFLPGGADEVERQEDNKQADEEEQDLEQDEEQEEEDEDEEYSLPPPDLSFLPKWSWNEQSKQHTHGGRINDVVGPVVPWMRLGAILLLLLQLGLLCIVMTTASCTEDGQATSLSYAWLYTLPFLYVALRMYIEIKSLRFVLPPYIQRVQAMSGSTRFFEVMGMNVSFTVWLLYCLFFSNLNLADVGTDSMFSATLVRSLRCPGNQIEFVWRQVLAQSSVAALSSILPDFGTMLLVMWVFTLFQMAWPLLATLTREAMCGQQVYDIGRDQQGDYNCFLAYLKGDIVDHEDVFFLLAEGNGMATFQNLAIPCQFAIVQNSELLAALTYAVPLSDGIASRVINSYILENCLQLNVQCSLFTIQRYLLLREGVEGYQRMLTLALPAASLFISFCTSVLKLSEIQSFFRFANHVLALDREENPYLSEDEQELEKQQLPQLTKTFRRNIFIIRAGTALLIVCLGYALLKFVAGLRCEQGIWNITGCVNLQSAAASSG